MTKRTAAKAETILKAEHLSVWIRNDREKIPILHDLSFSVKEGERLGIAGESGAGKSMTMHALTSLMPEKSTIVEGSVLYRQPDGSWQDLLELPYRRRHEFIAGKTAIIFQDSINALNPNMRIGRQWEETLKLHRPELSGQACLEHLLSRMEIFGIRGSADTLRLYPDQLSGGMRQRIAIAMALESPARILIADEPTTSLDAITQRNTVDFIRSLLDESRRTLIYISHHLGILQYLCERLLVMKDGRIVEDGPARTIFGAAKAAYTQELVRETRKIMGAGQNGI